MPYIAVELLHGRTDEQLAEYARRVTEATVEVLGASQERVHIRFFPMDRNEIAIGGRLLALAAPSPDDEGVTGS